VDSDPPLVELPDEVTFDLGEIADVLFVVDLAVDRTAPDSREHQEARHAQRLITTKLWPELGELLNDDGAERE
jgi:hypothetical protein